mgnify:CR=1 FL=1
MQSIRSKVPVIFIIGLIIGAGILFFNNQFFAYLTDIQSTLSILFIHSEDPRVLGKSISNYQVPVSTADAPQISYDKLYALINGYRRENKLSTLTAHRALEQSAALKLLDMQQNHYWTHKDPQGKESWYLFEQVGYHYEKAGENLSFGYTTEWKIFEEWRKSPEHNAQMLDPKYEHMGLAADCSTYAQGSQKTCIVVLHLGKQKL